MRSVIHIYIRSFAALLERQRNPELEGKPVIVTMPTGRTAHVVSVSQEALDHGVTEEMTSRHAGRRCPSAMILSADWDTYKAMSIRILDILSSYSPLLEPHGIDRSYLDLTGSVSLFGPPDITGKEIGKRILYETKFLCSIGLAENKLLAYAASTRCRPGSLLTINESNIQKVFASLPVSSLPGVGEKTQIKLAVLGITTIGELSAIAEEMLVRQFGASSGKLYKLAKGIDHSPVMPLYPPDTVSARCRFEDNMPREVEDLKPYIFRICESMTEELDIRKSNAGVLTVQVFLEDGDLVGDSFIPKNPISASWEIYSGISRILISVLDGREIEEINAILSSLSKVSGLQMSLFCGAKDNQILKSTICNIQSRYGDNSIVYGSSLRSGS
ncbi:MAG: DNA polymerase Y family protein [Armatimonadota bacterium]